MVFQKKEGRCKNIWARLKRQMQKLRNLLIKTLRDWYLSHLENNDDGSGLISTIAIRDAALNGLGVHLLISFMTRKLGFLLWQATSSMAE